jgi:hypothetical protein
MTSFVMTDDLTLVLKKAYSLYKAAEAAQRISSDLDQDKANMKVANESIDRGQKRLRKRRVTKRQRSKIERAIEYHQELICCTQAECEKKRSRNSRTR